MSYSSNLNDEENFNSQSSDEKMDTASESFPAQDTPNSILSSDFDNRESSTDQHVLRLQNPESPNVLRLAGPETIDNINIISKIESLTIESPADNQRPRNLGISPPRLSSTLISTTNHPLMGLASPDENYPDLIPKKVSKVEEEKDLSLSSIEDERTTEANGYDLYSPQCNTSKNNLYFSENFVTADSQILNESHRETSLPPDVARVDKKIVRRKIIPRISESSPKTDFLSTPHRVLGRIVDGNRDEDAIIKYVEERNKKLAVPHSTPKFNNITEPADVINVSEYHTGVGEWCESPAHVRTVPNFELPIELTTNVNIPADIESPDVISSSTHSEASLRAHLSIHTGRASLKHMSRSRDQNNSDAERRRIVVPPLEDDTCSLESISGGSLSEEEEPAPAPPQAYSDDEDTKRSKSSVSSCSSDIPEYSAAEEFRDERRWLTVTSGGRKVTCDMTVIEPYKRFVSHGGYDKAGVALIVFSACYLPDNSRTDYTYVMDNLFLYVIWSLSRLVTEQYVVVYLHGSAARRRLPSFHWLHECYRLIEHRLRKSLKHLYLVHPTFWLKSLVILTKPFISSKFFRKLSYVNSLDELMAQVPVEPNAIPELVKQYEATKR